MYRKVASIGCVEIQDMVQNRLVQNEMWFQLLKSNLKSMFSKINIFLTFLRVFLIRKGRSETEKDVLKHKRMF